MASIRESHIIEKLNENNYSTWKFKIQMLLIKEDLYELVTDELPTPQTDEWRKKNNKARALINLFIENSQIVHVKNFNTAKETYDALKNIHERSNLSSKLFLLRKLYNTKLEEGGNMNTHITKILEIVDKLNAIGEEISQSHISALLLCSVPKSYDTLITALEAREEADLNPSFIRSKLIDEYSRRIENAAPHDNAAKAFNINRNKQKYNFNYQSTSKQYRSNPKPDKFCSFCKRKNHFKSECWHLKNRSQNTLTKNQENKSSLCLEINKELALENYSKPINPNHIENLDKQMNNFAFIADRPDKNVWIVDSGSSSHISNNKNLFSRMHNSDKSDVVIANGQILSSYGTGEIELFGKTFDNKINSITLKDVLYVPDIQTNLLSVKKATQNNCTVNFSKENCNFMYAGKTFLTGHIKEGLYSVTFQNVKNTDRANIAHQCNNENCIEVWHRRLGHRNYDAIKQLVRDDLAIGLKVNNCTHKLECEICAKSKITSKPYPHKAQNRATKVLQIIHSDLCGPLKTPTIGGKSYLLTFIDDYSRYTTIFLLSDKTEVFSKLKEYVQMVRNKFGKIPQAIRTDNGREYVNKNIREYLKSLGIAHQLSVPYSSPQNGVAERKNRSLMEMTRCLLNEANLEHKFWGEAVSTATYLQNRLPTKANQKTPFEIWEKYRPNMSNIKLFGCKAYTYVDKSKRSKLDDRGQPGIFVGFDTNSKGYRIYTGDKKIVISRTVKFFEELNPNQIYEIENKQLENTQIEIDLSAPPANDIPQPTAANDEEPRRSQRSNRGVPPDRLTYYTPDQLIYYANNEHVQEPKNWLELQNIQNSTEKLNWLKATQEEINSLKENNTWTLVHPPQGKRVIGSKWTFKSKYNSDGNIEKFKARLVAQGFSQKFGEDYDETYAAVVSHTTIRALLATAAHNNLDVHHIDVKTAFLHGNLSEDVYMAQPEGYVVPGKEMMVCKLQKAIYGLKQAARAWQTKISETLRNLNFTQSKADACLYFRKTEKNSIYVIVYVDDILIAGIEPDIKQTVDNLRKEYEIKDLGSVKYYLGISIRKNEKGHFLLNQKIKINEIINKFNPPTPPPHESASIVGYIYRERQVVKIADIF